jgi:hypothetical protein
MLGRRFSRTWLDARAGERTRAVAGALALRGVCALVVLLFAVLALGAAGASAESLCTDTWTGPSEGSWATVGDWSTKEVPNSFSVACIGSGKTVDVTGADETGVLQGAGAISVSGGSLTIGNTLESSNIGALTLSGGTLAGAATLEVSSSLEWSSGTMSGSGSTVLGSSATGTINPGSGSVELAERKLVNHGTLTWSTGTVWGSKNAEIENSGTFNTNADTSPGGLSSHGLRISDGSNVWLHNTGTVQKAAGTEFTSIQFQIANEGTINAKSGAQIVFTGGTHGGEPVSGTWKSEGEAQLSFNEGTFAWGPSTESAGNIVLAGGVINAKGIGGNAHFNILGGGSALDLTESGGTYQLKELTFVEAGGSGTLTGPGTVTISTALSWDVGTMSGSGSTVLDSGATGTINPGSSGSVNLVERKLVNHGTLTWSTGTVWGSKSAEIENTGTFNTNADASAGSWSSYGLKIADGSNVWLHNTGTVQKAAGTEFTNIQFQVTNEGTIDAASGAQIIFSGGAHGGESASGTWKSEGGTQLSFNEGTFAWGPSTEIAGTVIFAGGSLNAKGISGSSAHIDILRSESVVDLTEASGIYKLKELTFEKAGAGTGTLTGPGTVDISTLFSWNVGAMSGSGSTVLGSSATGTIEGGESLSLAKRTLVNEGTVTFVNGQIPMSEGAKIVNVGTFKADSESGAPEITSGAGGARIVNRGTFEKAAGTGTTTVAPEFEEEGIVSQLSGRLVIEDPVTAEASTTLGPEGRSPGQPNAKCGDPVSCATGNDTETQTDAGVVLVST